MQRVMEHVWFLSMNPDTIRLFCQHTLLICYTAAAQSCFSQPFLSGKGQLLFHQMMGDNERRFTWHGAELSSCAVTEHWTDCWRVWSVKTGDIRSCLDTILRSGMALLEQGGGTSCPTVAPSTLTHPVILWWWWRVETAFIFPPTSMERHTLSPRHCFR